jgi:anti-anti-sigma factor
MKYSTEVIENIKIVGCATQRLDLYDRKDFEAECILNEGQTILAIDLSQVLNIDSSILGSLLHIGKNLSKINAELIVFALQPAVVGVFKLTRLEYLIKVRENRQQILSEFRAPAPQ